MTDRRTVQLVIGLLGAIGAILATALAYVVVRGINVQDQVLTLLGSTVAGIIGALSAMLVSTRSSGGDEPTPVTINQPASDPVPVDVAVEAQPEPTPRRRGDRGQAHLAVICPVVIAVVAVLCACGVVPK